MRPLAHIIETCLYAEDLAAAERFYGQTLGLQLHSREDGKFAFYELSEQMLLIFNPLAIEDDSHELPPHGARGPVHVCFRVDEETELDAWRAQLVEADVAIETEHIWPSGERSIYFRDPAGNLLELGPWRIWRPDAIG